MNMSETAIFFNPHTQFCLDDLLKRVPLAKELYVLPGNPLIDKYILPVSGGADSAALAIIMHLLFPAHPFEMVFTDTKADEVEIYKTLTDLEQFLGKPITRLVPEKGLFELIDQFNGYLPSSQARWCTRILKLETFKPWLAGYSGTPKHMFVGIRADEPTRLAFTIDEVETHMPLLDLGLRREDIFHILDRTIGIPQFYRRRTRSGCSVCPFQRRSELVGLLQEQPSEFQRGSDYEKTASSDVDRYTQAQPLWKDSGIALNWQTLPVPTSDLPIEGKRPKQVSHSLFGNRGIFVAGEFFFDGFMGNHEFIWHQRVISYSPTRAGLTRQIDDRYRHLLSTGEVFGLSPDDVRNKVRFATWYIELPEVDFDPAPPTGDGYTWQQGASYKQLQHIVEWATRALHAEGMRQQASKKTRHDSVQREWSEGSKIGLEKFTTAVGSVVASSRYQPTEVEPILTDEEELLSLPCPMCHI